MNYCNGLSPAHIHYLPHFVRSPPVSRHVILFFVVQSVRQTSQKKNEK